MKTSSDRNNCVSKATQRRSRDTFVFFIIIVIFIFIVSIHVFLFLFLFFFFVSGFGLRIAMRVNVNRDVRRTAIIVIRSGIAVPPSLQIYPCRIPLHLLGLQHFEYSQLKLQQDMEQKLTVSRIVH